MKTTEKFLADKDLLNFPGAFITNEGLRNLLVEYAQQYINIINNVKKYNCDRIVELVSDKRYNRSKPANILTNAPLALLQTAWETEADVLKKVNQMLNQKDNRINK